jgi:hypothetical protein
MERERADDRIAENVKELNDTLAKVAALKQRAAAIQTEAPPDRAPRVELHVADRKSVV